MINTHASNSITQIFLPETVVVVVAAIIVVIKIIMARV